MRLPLLILHITGGTLGILSGFFAMCFQKGSPQHRVSGNVFVISMLTMSSAAVYLAILKHQTPNILGGVLTFYLVTSGWLTARRGEGQGSGFDWGVALIPLVGGFWVSAIGMEKLFSHNPPNDSVPLAVNFFIGAVMLSTGGGDVRMMVRGLSGTKRLVRHLWRMCFALFIATGSFFLGQQQVLPATLRGSPLLVALGILPLVLLIFWVIRLRFTHSGRIFTRRVDTYSLRA